MVHPWVVGLTLKRVKLWMALAMSRRFWKGYSMRSSSGIRAAFAIALTRLRIAFALA